MDEGVFELEPGPYELEVWNAPAPCAGVARPGALSYVLRLDPVEDAGGS